MQQTALTASSQLPLRALAGFLEELHDLARVFARKSRAQTHVGDYDVPLGAVVESRRPNVVAAAAVIRPQLRTVARRYSQLRCRAAGGGAITAQTRRQQRAKNCQEIFYALTFFHRRASARACGCI